MPFLQWFPKFSYYNLTSSHGQRWLNWSLTLVGTQHSWSTAWEAARRWIALAWTGHTSVEGVKNSFRTFFDQVWDVFWMSFLIPFTWYFQRFAVFATFWHVHVPFCTVFAIFLALQISTYHFAWYLLHVGTSNGHVTWYLHVFATIWYLNLSCCIVFATCWCLNLSLHSFRYVLVLQTSFLHVIATCLLSLFWLFWLLLLLWCRWRGGWTFQNTCVLFVGSRTPISVEHFGTWMFNVVDGFCWKLEKHGEMDARQWHRKYIKSTQEMRNNVKKIDK